MRRLLLEVLRLTTSISAALPPGAPGNRGTRYQNILDDRDKGFRLCVLVPYCAFMLLREVRPPLTMGPPRASARLREPPAHR